MSHSNKYHIEKIKLFSDNKFVDKVEVDNLNSVIKKLSDILDAPPQFIIQMEGEDKPVFDTYIESLLNEIVYSIRKVISSVKNVETYHMLSFYSNYYEDREFSGFLTDIYAKEFWGKTEIAYIRMASTWDRIGQLLSFIFLILDNMTGKGFFLLYSRFILISYQCMKNSKHPIHGRVFGNTQKRRYRRA